MRPFRHAVSLIDASERYWRQTSEDAGRRATADTAAADKHLRRQQKKVDVTGRDGFHDGATLKGRHVSVDARATDTLRQLTHLHHKTVISYYFRFQFKYRCFQVSLVVSGLPKKEFWRIVAEEFYRLDALHVVQSTVSKHREEHRELMLITDWPHPSLNHQMTPDGTDTAPFMLCLWTPVSNNKHYSNKPTTRMWANAQRDGRPAEHRWHPLFNAAKFG